jgi:hypothetical protein
MPSWDAMKYVDFCFIVLVSVYVIFVIFRWTYSYGVISRMVVVLPFSVYGDVDQKLGESLASSVQARLKRLRDVYSVEQESGVTARLALNLGLGETLTLPAVRTFDLDVETITLKPFELGPVTISLNKFIFERLPKKGTVLNGSYERYGDAVKIAVHQDGRPSFAAAGNKPAELPDLIDNVVYQLVAANWISDPSARWPALKLLTEGLERYAAYRNSSDPALLPDAIEAMHKAVSTAPRWPIPKLFLGWVLFVENQTKVAADALPGLREAAGLLDEVALNSPDRRTKVIGKIATLHVYSYIVRGNLDRCDEMAPFVDSLNDARTYLESLRPPDKDLEWHIKMAQGDSSLALVQMLEDSRCLRVAGRLLQGHTPAEKAIEHIVNAERLFTQVVDAVGAQTEVIATATYNRALANVLRGELLFKGKHSEADVMSAANAANRDFAALLPDGGQQNAMPATDRAFAALNLPSRVPFLRSGVAHLYLLKAAAIAERDPTAAESAAALATEQLRKMAFEQEGYPSEWARQHRVDTLLAQGDWVAGIRALLEVLDGIQVDTKPSARTGWWNAARGAASRPERIQDIAESERAADSGVLFVPDDLRALVRAKLQRLLQRNTYAVAPAAMAASMIMDGSDDARLTDAQVMLQMARDRVQGNSHLWVGRDVAHLLDATQARLEALGHDTTGARTKMERLERIRTAAKMGNGKNAVLCEMIRSYLALGDVQAASSLERLLPDEVRPLLPPAGPNTHP